MKKYADEHPSDASTYLSSVTGDTNSTNIHCAETLTCATCHGQNKTKEVIDDGEKGGEGHSVNGSYGGFVDNGASNYARTFNGDIWMGFMKHLFILIVEAMEETGVVDVTEEVVEEAKEAEEAKVEGMPMST